MPKISFSVTEEEGLDITANAKQKGLTASALAKMAAFQYVSRYPLKSAPTLEECTCNQDLQIVKEGLC